MPADLGIGIILGIFSSNFFQLPLLPAVIWGIIFCLLPDVDFILTAFFRNLKTDNHRDLIHLPIPFLAIGSLVIYILLGKDYLLMFLIGSTYHFIHDTFVMGWGVKWLYPFSKYNYMFFFLWDKDIPEKRFFKKATDAEIKKFEEKFGDKNWIRNYYLTINRISITEYSILILSLILLGAKIWQN